MERQEERQSAWKPQPEDARSPYDVDYARIVHSASFRRLQGKTQILSLGDSDFYRTRLTHSLEVAQIAGGIRRQLEKHLPEEHPARDHLPDTSLVQAIGFAHDLGHPPFGHGGEVALNYCMRDSGGFEGNGQTFRILSKLELFSERHGADLTRRTLLGVLKYPVPYTKAVNASIQPRMNEALTSIRLIDQTKSKPPKCFFDSENDVVEWILGLVVDRDRELFQRVNERCGSHHKAVHKSFDCSIMDTADDIAYGVHDLEDAISLGLIGENDFRKYISKDKCDSFLAEMRRKYGHRNCEESYNNLVKGLFGVSNPRKQFIGRIIHHFITNILTNSVNDFMEPLFIYQAHISPECRQFLEALKKLVAEIVIDSPNVKHLELKGQKMVVSVFEAIQSDPKSLLPRDHYEKYKDSENNLRVICDYVAGMTDTYLIKTYERLFSPRMGSIFDKL